MTISEDVSHWKDLPKKRVDAICQRPQYKVNETNDEIGRYYAAAVDCGQFGNKSLPINVRIVLDNEGDHKNQNKERVEKIFSQVEDEGDKVEL